MGKKVGLFVLCLMLVCFALVGAAEGKQKAVVADKVPLLMYCPEEGKDDPEFQSYWGTPFEISPPGKYDMQVEFFRGDEALFDTITASQYRSEEYFYIDVNKFPTEPGMVHFKVTGESENAYIDELFELKVVPYTGRETPQSYDVHANVGEKIDLWLACFEELLKQNSRLGFGSIGIPDKNGVGKYLLKEYEFTPEEKGIYHLLGEVWNCNILEYVDIRVIAGDVSEADIKSDTEAYLARHAVDEGTKNNGKLRARIDSSFIRKFRRGVPLYCKSDEYPDIKLKSDFYYLLNVSREGNFGLKIELVDGDSSIKNLFGLEHYRKENLFGLKNAKNLKKPGSAVLRITGENGNYYVDEVFTVNIEPYQGPELKMTKNYIHVNLGEETDVVSSFRDLCPDVEEGAGFEFKKGNNYNYGDVVNENFEWIDYSFRALKKGIYDAQLLLTQSNVEFEFNVKIYAGDYPYLLSTDAEAFPGTDIKVLADVLMEEAKDKEIEYTLEGNEKVTIDPEGRLSIAEDASGEVLIKAKPAGLDVEPAELKVKILGYNGKKPADSFDEATLKTFDYLGTNPLYSTESGSVWSTWLKQNSIGIDLGLSCGEKVTKVTVLPVRSPDELKELVLANPESERLACDQSGGTAEISLREQPIFSDYGRKPGTLCTAPSDAAYRSVFRSG